MSAEPWDISELVVWGLERCGEAERDGRDYIVVREIYRGATRISSRVEQFPQIARMQMQWGREQGYAVVILRRTADGWSVHDSANVVGDPPAADDIAGMAWWNAMTKSERSEWLYRANSARPADAWASFKAARCS